MDEQDQVNTSTYVAMPMLHTKRPRLIVLEGIDLSGRTTQVELLCQWLVAQRYPVTTTAWRTSPLISDVLARARTGPPLRPLTYSMLYCADHLDRTQRVIKPALARGEIVLADRYMYTAFARDTARGLSPSWVRSLYRFFVQPDVVFYLHISPEEAVKRRLALQQQRQGDLSAKRDSRSEKNSKASKKDKEHKHARKPEKAQTQPSQATIGTQTPQLTQEALESFRNFEIKMYSEYQQMQKEFGFTVIEGNQPIEQVQALLRRAVGRLLLEM